MKFAHNKKRREQLYKEEYYQVLQDEISNNPFKVIHCNNRSCRVLFDSGSQFKIKKTLKENKKMYVLLKCLKCHKDTKVPITSLPLSQ